jgi:hypothetical protein
VVRHIRFCGVRRYVALRMCRQQEGAVSRFRRHIIPVRGFRLIRKPPHLVLSGVLVDSCEIDQPRLMKVAAST